MLEQELKEIWKNSADGEKIKFDLSRLMMELNKKMNQMERSIRRRDRREIFTAIIAIPIFGYLAYEVPFPITKIGLILAMIGFGWGIYKFRANKKNKLPTRLNLSFREQLENQKANMVQEAKLLDTVLYWFLIPSFFPYAISILGFGNPADYGWSHPLINELLPIPFIYKVAYLVLGIIIYGAILWTNKWVLKKTVQPLIKDIERVQQQMEKID